MRHKLYNIFLYIKISSCKNIIYMKIRKFNENSSLMLQFCLTTKSESGDNYMYFIEHTQMPTNEEIERFLLENGNDFDEDGSYENINLIEEIKNFKRLN